MGILGIEPRPARWEA